MKRPGEKALRGAAALAAGLLLAVFADPSFAASSRACRQLEAELASAGKGGGKAQSRRYERAAAGQRQQLAIAKARYRSDGCGFGILSPRSCKPLNAQIERMEVNLAALDRKRSQASPAPPTRSRARILAALDANGCRAKPVEARKAAPREMAVAEPVEIDADLFARLSGADVVEDEETQAPLAGPVNVTRILNPNGEVDVYGPQGTFATMCVRTCDGYFFPVSPNSSAADFERDEKNCEATCPGTEVQLYYRPSGYAGSETMMSTATGEAYGSLPNAYVYRDLTKPRVPACGCRGAMVDPSFSIVAGETAEEEAPAEPVIPAPSARPDPALDPETLANAEGKLDIATIRRILKPKPVAAHTLPSGERKIRVVGPVFLPDPAAAIDLKAPAPKQVR
jgi:hypothetical protein